MEPLTPTQWLVMRLAFMTGASKVGDSFETWDLVEALKKRSDPRSLHYKTIATHLDALVEKGYLDRDPATGGFSGDRHQHRLAVSKAEIAARHIDRWLEQLDDDAELLKVLGERIRLRQARSEAETA